MKKYKIYLLLFLFLILIGGSFVLGKTWFNNKSSIKTLTEAVEKYLSLIQEGKSEEEIREYLSKLSKEQVIEAMIKTSPDPNDNQIQESIRTFYEEAFKEAERKYNKSFNQLPTEETYAIAYDICWVSKRVTTPNINCPPQQQSAPTL